MSFASAILMPFALLLPAAGPAEARDDVSGAPICTRFEALPARAIHMVPERALLAGKLSTGNAGAPSAVGAWPFRLASLSFQPETVHQVRIEQRMTIRVVPRPSPVRPNMLMDLPQREIGPRFEERRIGKCVSISGISGVQTNGGNQLILFMRDRRIVSADLERSCRARDFYSGFYLSNSSDGRLCVDRDTLQSRSGANCKLSRIRQLVEVDD